MFAYSSEHHLIWYVCYSHAIASPCPEVHATSCFIFERAISCPRIVFLPLSLMHIPSFLFSPGSRYRTFVEPTLFCSGCIMQCPLVYSGQQTVAPAPSPSEDYGDRQRSHVEAVIPASCVTLPVPSELHWECMVERTTKIAPMHRCQRSH